MSKGLSSASLHTCICIGPQYRLQMQKTPAKRLYNKPDGGADDYNNKYICISAHISRCAVISFTTVRSRRFTQCRICCKLTSDSQQREPERILVRLRVCCWLSDEGLSQNPCGFVGLIYGAALSGRRRAMYSD